MRTTRKTAAAALAAALGVTALAGCGGTSSPSSSGGAASKTVTLVSHDDFAASASVLKDFTRKTGYTVKVLKTGDAGEAVNKAILTKGDPQGDVFFGVDNTLLSRALDNGLFTPYAAKGLAATDPTTRLDADKHRVTPIDSGYLCVNYDRAYFTKHHVTPPSTFADLVEPQYRNLLVTENVSTSSPGLGFMLGTIAEYGSGAGWQTYWKQLKANGVKVDDTWEQAYDQDFSGSAGGRKAGGSRPLVVSYASSPPAEVLDAKPQPTSPADAPTGVATGTCFRQIEFAGLLDGAKNTAGGKALIDFMISKEFQQDMPLEMFVDPVVEGAKEPAVFTTFGAKVDHPETMAPATIAAHRDQWIQTWSSLLVK